MPESRAYTLKIKFHQDDAGYLAFYTALPGCHSWGNSYEDAVRNAQEVLIGYLEALQKSGEITSGEQPRDQTS